MLVILVNDAGEEKYISVEDDWLIENCLDVGSVWPEDDSFTCLQIDGEV